MMLQDEFGGEIMDDGLILRQALPILTGIPEEMCFTQEGKATWMQIGDRQEQVRKGLGELGNWLEARYGEDIVPLRAMQLAQQNFPEANFYIYPSVRKSQGRAYKRLGGIVVEVARPGAVDSGNAFDWYDPGLVDITLQNDGSLEDLRDLVKQLPNLIDAL